MDNENNLETNKVNINDSNIFEDFSLDKKLKDDVEQYKKQKGFYEYISIIWNILKILNLSFLLVFSIILIYIFVQKNENLSNSTFLDPICFIISDENFVSTNYCSSVSFLLKDYKNKLDSLEKKQFDSITSIIQELHDTKDFNNSRDVAFLLEKSSSRLKPTEILKEFDNLKNKFEPIDKTKIKCNNLEITKLNILTAKCEVLSSHWETGLVNFEGETNNSLKKPVISWTSISIASSFLNFIEKKSDKFSIINKQKKFDFENIVWEEQWYTKKTSFTIKLRYNTSNLSL